MSNETQARQIVNSFPVQKATVEDIEIEYRILENKNKNNGGDGNDNAPILFIAGLRITMDMWPPRILNESAQSNRSVIIYNNRGTGNSSTELKNTPLTSLPRTLQIY